MGYGHLPPSQLPSAITKAHYPQSLPGVTSISPWKPRLPSCSTPAAQGRGRGRATLARGGGDTKMKLRNHREWDFESLLPHVLARYLRPPCLPDPRCIVACSSQLFPSDRCDTQMSVCDGQSGRENSIY